MSKEKDFVVVSKKSIAKIEGNLQKLRDAVDAAFALFAVLAPDIGEVKPKKRKPRAKKEEIVTITSGSTTQAPVALAAKVEKEIVKIKDAVTKPPKIKANGSFAPAMPRSAA